MSEMLVLDPAPEEWLSDERKNRLVSELGASASLLREVDVLDTVLNHWIRRELAGDPVDTQACLDWARTQWGYRLESLFLQYKQDLDQASYKFIRVKELGLALEIYHRLIAKEDSFESLSIKFGTGPERFYGGLVKLQPLGNLPSGLSNFMRRLKPGGITKPVRLNDKFAVVQLNEFIPAVQGEEMERKLLSQELQKWLQGMAGHLKAQLSS